jgi:hypothetical protein
MKPFCLIIFLVSCTTLHAMQSHLSDTPQSDSPSSKNLLLNRVASPQVKFPTASDRNRRNLLNHISSEALEIHRLACLNELTESPDDRKSVSQRLKDYLKEGQERLKQHVQNGSDDTITMEVELEATRLAHLLEKLSNTSFIQEALAGNQTEQPSIEPI